MVFYGLLFISCFLIALVLRLRRTVFYSVAVNSVAVVNQLLSDGEEEVKLPLVQKSTNRLVGSMALMFLVIIVAFAVGSIPLIIYLWISGISFGSLDFSSFPSILTISVGATLSFVIPLGKPVRSGYSELSQLLHRIALDNYVIGNKLFGRERKLIRKRNLTRGNSFVIVSGLARAGTTSLMNDLSGNEAFVSLSYANMPFLMCPNLWAKFYRPKNKQLKERSHKDGIMIGLNSNEALEEYFFKVKANDAYISDFRLTEYVVPEDDYKDYLDYQTIVKHNNDKIYLAKNNNFLLRYHSLRKYNDEFLMLIMFRDPLSHAASLLEKHRDYLLMQQEDPFVLEYMNWLGHHEFGKKQKPFIFNNTDASLDVLSGDFPEGNRNTLDYWLKSWINYYSYVLTIDHPKTLLINYDTYCSNPGETISAILEKLDITDNGRTFNAFINSRKNADEYSNDLLEKALEIHIMLVKNAFQPS